MNDMNLGPIGRFCVCFIKRHQYCHFCAILICQYSLATYSRMMMEILCIKFINKSYKLPIIIHHGPPGITIHMHTMFIITKTTIIYIWNIIIIWIYNIGTSTGTGIGIMFLRINTINKWW